MPENQAHGKIWEKDIAINVYKVTEEEFNSFSHGACIDVPREFNHLDGTDLSIKCSCGNSIDMADIGRIFKKFNSGEKIHLVLIRCVQINPTTKKVKDIIEVDLTNSGELLFGTVTQSEIDEFVEYIKAIPHYGRTAEHQKTYKQMASVLNKKSGWISYSPKVDSEKQRRVQGHFKNFSKFVKENPERVIAQSQTGDFRGGKIAEEIVSTPRLRKKKEPAPAPDSAPR